MAAPWLRAGSPNVKSLAGLGFLQHLAETTAETIADHYTAFYHVDRDVKGSQAHGDRQAAMSRKQIEFTEKDAALRDDVRVLGALVGDLLKEQGGMPLFERVEAARRAAIQRREGDSSAEAQLMQAVSGLPVMQTQDLIRGFATYFQLVNLAERVHRIRRRRDYLRQSGAPQSGSLADALAKLRANGCDASSIRSLLARIRFEPVFTAHPTEPTRRTILRKEQKIARLLVDRLDPSMTPPESKASLGNIRTEVTSGWQTEEHPSARMTVADELEHVLFHLTDVIYRVIPPFYETLHDALVEVLGEDFAEDDLPPLIRFASWVGGDMDGNPNVTATTIRNALARHRASILPRYFDECRRLAEKLSQSTSRVPVSRELWQCLETYRVRFEQEYSAVPERHRDMPYRVFFRLLAARLQATYDDGPEAYAGASEFLEDVRLAAKSLEANKGRHAGWFAVHRLQRRVETFGFHLATLDVRQDALVHRRVIAEGLNQEQWMDMPAEDRTRQLRRALEQNTPPSEAWKAEARDTLQVFKAIGECRRKYGEEAIGPYIISMTQGADDLLSVLLLARWSGLHSDGQVPLDIVPLFETVEDLQNGPKIMQSLLADAFYRRHLQQRDDRQMIMVGYSDSNKDGGLAAARWSLQAAQAEFVTTLKEYGVDCTIFHGRGGTISRGGGRTQTAVLGAPAGSVNGRLRVTEQGEIINAKYGLRGIALRNLEQAVGAVMLATSTATKPAEQPTQWNDAMQTIARESRRKYRQLVYEEDDFHDFFRQATPIDVIERMQIGSRPSARRAKQGIANLRAIPWVFSWTQSRHMLPGWYGLGHGLSCAIEQHGLEQLRQMAQKWYFFRAMLSDVEMVLAKADMGIARRYAALAEEPLQSIASEIEKEFSLTVETVLNLKQSDALLSEEPVIQRAIRLRNPYVDPMSMLQVDLLQRWRATQRQDADLLRALLASVNGIAKGLQNTG